jgi:hypothetical protein
VSTSDIEVGGAGIATARFFAIVAGVKTLADPDDVFFDIMDPDGNVVTFHYGVDAEVVKDAVGIYHILVPVDEDGWWRVRARATGTDIVGAKSISFCVGATAWP